MRVNQIRRFRKTFSRFKIARHLTQKIKTGKSSKATWPPTKPSKDHCAGQYVHRWTPPRFLSHQRKKSTLSGFVHHPQSGEGIISTPYRPFVPLPNLWTSSQEYKDFDSFVSVKFKTCNQRNRAATCFGWPKLGKRFVWIHENQERNGCVCPVTILKLALSALPFLITWKFLQSRLFNDGGDVSIYGGTTREATPKKFSITFLSWHTQSISTNSMWA